MRRKDDAAGTEDGDDAWRTRDRCCRSGKAGEDRRRVEAAVRSSWRATGRRWVKGWSMRERKMRGYRPNDQNPRECECDDVQRAARLSNLKARVVTQPRGIVRAAETRRPDDPMITLIIQLHRCTGRRRGMRTREARGEDMWGHLSWTLGYGPLDLGSSC